MRLIGALLLILAILAIASYGPGGTLGAVLYSAHPPLLNTLQAGIQRNVSPGLWNNVVLPVLLTPAWLPPLLAGMVCFLVGVGSARRG
jgi:hypothetical protein